MTYQNEIKRWGKETARRKAIARRKQQRIMRGGRRLFNDVMRKRQREYERAQATRPQAPAPAQAKPRGGLFAWVGKLFNRKTGKK